MKNKISSIAATVLVVSSLALAIPVFAQQNPTTSSTTRRMRGQAGQMIDQRLTSLNNLITRVQGLKNVSDAEKVSLAGTIQSVISNLTTLKTAIATDTSTSSLHTDMTAITQANRVYALIIPQVNIIAAGDRVQTIVSMINGVSTKLQTRLSQATTTSTTSTAVTSAMSDLTSKLSDANSQALAAISEVSSLTPDQGDKTKMAANTAALKDARSKIQVATKDIVAARKDVTTVMKGLK